jgi:serine/threonine protein kinase
MSEKKFHSFKINDYDIGDTIRVLPMGRVKTAKSKRTSEPIAIKILNKSKIIKSNQIPHIHNEFKILQTL